MESRRQELKRSALHHRIWMLAATIGIVAGGLLAIAEFSTVEAPVSIEWWMLIPAFLLAESLVFLLAITSIPVFLALRGYERLARRHDELGMAQALTKELDNRHTSLKF